MYLFPRFEFSERALAAAQASNRPADLFYARELLEATGVCMVPGGGFGQAPGTFHIRSTFLPPESDMEEFVERIKEFHVQFVSKYR